MDLKQIMSDSLERLGSTYIKDFGWIPEDKCGVSPMGKARTPIEFTVECASLNEFVANTIAGRDPRGGKTKEDRQAYFKAIDTKAAAIKELESSIALLRAAIADIPADGLSTEVESPWGGKTTAFKFATTAINHMSYHDGQLNYIQALYGDDADHWGE